MQLNDNRETNPGTKLGVTSGSGNLRGCKSTLEKYHSRLILPLCSSLGSPFFPGRMLGQPEHSSSQYSLVHKEWLGLKSCLVLPSLIYPFQLTGPKYLQAVLPKVSLIRFTEPCREYHFSLVLLKLLDACACRWLPSGRNVFYQSRKIPSYVRTRLLIAMLHSHHQLES